MSIDRTQQEWAQLRRAMKIRTRKITRAAFVERNSGKVLQVSIDCCRHFGSHDFEKQIVTQALAPIRISRAVRGIQPFLAIVLGENDLGHSDSQCRGKESGRFHVSLARHMMVAPSNIRFGSISKDPHTQCTRRLPKEQASCRQSRTNTTCWKRTVPASMWRARNQHPIWPARAALDRLNIYAPGPATSRQQARPRRPRRTCVYCGALTFKGMAARAAWLATLASHACASAKSPLLLQPPPR
jgi:hypothetical protein